MFLVLALTAGAVADDGATWAMLINGGANPKSNFASHVVHLEQMFDVLVGRGVPPDHILVLSADGPVTHVDQAWRDPTIAPHDADLWEGTRASRLLPQTQLIDTVWDRTPELRQARKRSVAEAFGELSGQLKAGDTLFVYTTDHGTKEGELRLWREEASVDEVRAWVAGIDPDVRVVLAMSQCYSGAFVDSVLPASETDFPDACGVFSVPADRRAYGCYPEGRDRFIGHGFRLIDGLTRHDSIDAAHREVLVSDRTPDVPLRSSDVFLAQRLDAEAARTSRSLEAVVDGLLAEAELGRFESELRTIDDIALAFGTFAPRRLAQLTLASVAVREGTKAAKTYAERWEGARTFAAKEQLRRFELAHPGWSSRLDKEAAATLTDSERMTAMEELLPPLRAAVAEQGATERLAELVATEREADQLKWRMVTREGAIERMRWLLTRIAGTVLVEGTGDAATLERLVTCESTTLGLASGAAVVDDADWPSVDTDLARLEAVAPSWLGVKYSPIPEEERVEGLRRGAAEVIGVMEGSPAAEAGIQLGDVLIGPPDAPFSEPQALRLWAQAQSRGSPVALAGRRVGEPVVFELTFEPYPVKLPALIRPTAGDPAPEVQSRLERLDGGPMPALEGRRHLLFWWATWCGPCKLAVPAVLAWSAETGVPVVAITDEGPDVWSSFMKKWSDPFPELAVTDPERRSWASYGVSATPTFVLVDAQGDVEWRQRGYNHANGLSIPGSSGSP
jgi:thiol-disulfide isomerase/thioredoxin